MADPSRPITGYPAPPFSYTQPNGYPYAAPRPPSQPLPPNYAYAYRRLITLRPFLFFFFFFFFSSQNPKHKLSALALFLENLPKAIAAAAASAVTIVFNVCFFALLGGGGGGNGGNGFGGGGGGGNGCRDGGAMGYGEDHAAEGPSNAEEADAAALVGCVLLLVADYSGDGDVEEEQGDDELDDEGSIERPKLQPCTEE